MFEGFCLPAMDCNWNFILGVFQVVGDDQDHVHEVFGVGYVRDFAIWPFDGLAKKLQKVQKL